MGVSRNERGSRAGGGFVDRLVEKLVASSHLYLRSTEYLVAALVAVVVQCTCRTGTALGERAATLGPGEEKGGESPKRWVRSASTEYLRATTSSLEVLC